MGLFSKKSIVCERCGKEYQAIVTIGAHICKDCKAILQQKEDKVKGYVQYAKDVLKCSYTEEQLDAIAAHRDAILEKYRMTQGITIPELTNASDNYKKLTDDQAADVLFRMANSSVEQTMGAASTGFFFVPTAYEKIVVDVEDVFAVGYTPNYRLADADGEVLMCAIFTNDPYVPVFPMVYVGKLGFFEIFKSKGGRKGVSSKFEIKCPNLTYPVQELKLLKKQIKSEGVVKGNPDVPFVLDHIENATGSIYEFNIEEMYSDLDEKTELMLHDYGYILETRINQIMKMDKMFNRRYWAKQIQRIANYDIGGIEE